MIQKIEPAAAIRLLDAKKAQAVDAVSYTHLTPPTNSRV